MRHETTSRHIRSSFELFIMVPIKPGFVQTSELVATYSSRVRTVLDALFEVRQQKIERGYGEPIGPIELLETIHRVQWTVLEPFDEEVRPDLPPELWRQIRSPQLILTSHFDTSWEHYFSELIVTGQPLLDLIFSHCVDYEGHSCLDGYEAFSSFIRRHQRPVNFLYAGSPDISEHDVGFLKGALTEGARGTPHRAKLPRVRDLAEEEIRGIRKAAGERALAGLRTPYSDVTLSARRTIYGLKDLRDRLFSDHIELVSGGGKARSGRQLFDRAIASVLILEPDAVRLAATASSSEPKEELGPDRPLGWAIGEVDELRKLRESEEGQSVTQDPKPDKQALLENVQGNILRPHPVTDYRAALLISCRDTGGFASLVEAVREKMDEAPAGDPAKAVSLNFALTYPGLARMQLGEDVLAQFPCEFRQGLEERAGLVGDVEENHPSRWQHPVDNGKVVHLSRIDALLFVYAATGKARDTAVEDWCKASEHFHVVQSIPSQLRTEGERPIDPFGFVDPVSQPWPPKDLDDASMAQTPPTADVASCDRVPLGEFVLGYTNRAGNRATSASAEANSRSSALFRDSTFVVVRKMRMDKDAFDTYVDRGAVCVDPAQGAKAASDAKLYVVGRRQDGTHPLASGMSNDFTYAKDPDGVKCPLHAHARRANPRVPNAARILRRGMTYGTWKDGKLSYEDEYGILFIAYNASIAEQYELIQRWINGGNITGQSSLQNDLHTGTPQRQGVPRWAYDSNEKPFLMPDPEPGKQFATLRWGLYGFVPSKSALKWLADELALPYDRYAEDVASVARGRVRLAELDALPADLAVVEWKRLLEEVAEAGSRQARQADDIWAAIRAEGGVRKVRAGLAVVASEQPARIVLADDGRTYSVEEYANRIARTIGDHYLARDVAAAAPEGGHNYKTLAHAPNAWFQNELSATAFDDARRVARDLLADLGIYNQAPAFDAPEDATAEASEPHPRRSISLRDLAMVVVARLCQEWFGLPSVGQEPGQLRPYPDPLVGSLERYLVTSRYTFQVSPEPKLERDAVERGARIPDSYGETLQGKLAEYLGAVGYDSAVGKEAFGQAVMGAVVGFAPPTVGAIIRVLDQWIENGELWRVLALAAEQHEAILPLIGRALGATPSPTILYRTAVADARLGAVSIERGTRVVVALGSVYTDARRRGSPLPEAWLFGGQHGEPGGTNNEPPHGCPARKAGLDVIAAIVTALAERSNVKRERRFCLSYDT